MTKESLIWKRLNLIQKKQKDWHLVRIESNTINGIPDVNACINGLEFWIELKANDAKNYGLSKYQINWHLKRHKCGGHSFILNRSLKHEAFELLEIREPGFPFPVLTLEHPYDWSKLEELLGSGRCPSCNPVSR